MTGAVVSVTVTVWVALAELPEASVAVQVTTVDPIGNGPLLSTLTVGEGSVSALTVGVPRLTGVKGAVASTVTSAGAVIVGGVVSGAWMSTVMLWLPVLDAESAT